jgi:hypothetical protein
MRLGIHWVWAGIAGLAGGLVLLGYFFEFELMDQVQLSLMEVTALLASGALLLGLVNLVSVHVKKVGDQDADWLYSAVLVLTLLFTLVIGVGLGPDSAILLAIFSSVQLPVEASLMALLSVTMIIAGFRLLQRRRDWSSLIFVATVLVVLVVSAPWPAGDQGLLGELRAWLRAEIVQVLAVGGARGILIGVALGAIVTGLRVLLAAERPYGD